MDAHAACHQMLKLIRLEISRILPVTQAAVFIIQLKVQRLPQRLDHSLMTPFFYLLADNHGYILPHPRHI